MQAIPNLLFTLLRPGPTDTKTHMYIIVSASHQCFITDEQHQNLDISDSSELDQHLTWSQDITAGEEQQGRTRTVNGDFAFFAYSKS